MFSFKIVFEINRGIATAESMNYQCMKRHGEAHTQITKYRKPIWTAMSSYRTHAEAALHYGQSRKNYGGHCLGMRGCGSKAYGSWDSETVLQDFPGETSLQSSEPTSPHHHKEPWTLAANNEPTRFHACSRVTPGWDVGRGGGPKRTQSIQELLISSQFYWELP